MSLWVVRSADCKVEIEILDKRRTNVRLASREARNDRRSTGKPLARQLQSLQRLNWGIAAFHETSSIAYNHA